MSDSTSASSISTKIALCINSTDTTKRDRFVLRFRIPRKPAMGPLLTRTLRPTAKKGYGSARVPLSKLVRSASMSLLGSVAKIPPNPTSVTTPGVCSTCKRSRRASRTKTYPEKRGSCKTTLRSFQRRTS
jgi:hypothetical protein